MALAPYAPILDAAGLHDRLAADVSGTLLVIRQNTDEDGLVAILAAHQRQRAADRLGLRLAREREGCRVSRWIRRCSTA